MPSPGDLDLSFASEGQLRLCFPDSSEQRANSVMVSSKGKLMLSWGYLRLQFEYPLGHCGIECLNENGTPDTSFGDEGYVSDRFDEREDALPSAGHQIFQMSDQRFLLFGSSPDSHGNPMPCFAMYGSNGLFDANFGQKGKLVLKDPTSHGPYGGASICASFQSSDHLLAVYQKTFNFNNWAAVVVRIITSGHIDEHFNNNLGHTVARPSSGENFSPRGIVAQHDRKFLVYGQSNNGNGIVLRFEADGQLDTSFANLGIYRQSNWTINYLTVQPDTKLLLCGESEHTALLTRLNSDASTDKDFNNGEPQLTPIGDGEASRWDKVVFDSKGQIVTVGTSSSFMESTAVLGRFDSHGQLDESFAKGKGWVTINSEQTVNQPVDVALDMRGFIYVLGKHQGISTEPYFVLFRYIG